MAGIQLEFAQFGHFDSFDIIRSTTSMVGIANTDLPTPIVTGLKTMYYVDSAVVRGQTYYYKVRVYRGSSSFVSTELEVLAEKDDHWDKVVALLHLDGNVDDQTGKEFTITDSVDFSSTISKFGSSLDISGCTGLLACTHDDFRMLGQNYTIECFIQVSALAINEVDPIIISIGNNTDDGSQEILFGVNASTRRLYVQVYDELYGGPAYIIDGSTVASSTALSLNRLYHIAFCRSGRRHYIFLDGNLVWSRQTPTNYILSDLPADLLIGGVISAGRRKWAGRFDGYIDEVRVTRGVARYTQNFVPPTLPFLDY